MLSSIPVKDSVYSKVVSCVKGRTHYSGCHAISPLNMSKLCEISAVSEALPYMRRQAKHKHGLIFYSCRIHQNVIIAAHTKLRAHYPVA